MMLKLANTEQWKCSMMRYLKQVDADFETPLSQKVDLSMFSDKMLKHGYVIVSYDEGQINALIGFYCNDIKNRVAVLSILSTREECRGKGLAKKLVLYAISVCKSLKMKHFVVDSVNPVAIQMYKSLGFAQYDSQIVNNTKKEYLILEL